MTAAPAVRKAHRAAPLALLLPLFLMAVGALETPWPWSRLWIAVPALGAIGFLGNLHRWRLGWLAPAAAVTWAVVEPGHPVGAWLCVGATATAALLGLARRQAVPQSRALWAFAPLVALMMAFPASSLYAPTVRAAAAGITRMGEEVFRTYSSLGLENGGLSELAHQLQMGTQALVWMVSHLLPWLLFTWAVALVAMAVLLARRLARAVGRPLKTVPFAKFQVPEAAIWLLLVGLGLIAVREPRLLPAGVSLLLCMVLAYGLQGLAILDLAMRARGFSPGMVWVLFLFVVFFSFPALLLLSAGVGLADVWLDLRRRLTGPGRHGRGA